jgi:Mg-chelatase subunit ChlD
VELLAEQTPDADDRPLGPDLDVLGLGASSQGGHGYRARSTGGWSIPDGAGLIGGGDSPFRGYLGDLRERGLDVVFVIDATGSMQRFIDRARETIDDVIQDLASVVPSLRIGLVAYRDLGDDWITQDVDLTTDRYHIHNFLLGLRASGGRREVPDFEEAVEVGLEVATQEMSWREGARRVILLVGDAPYHDDDRAAANATVRSFARDRHSLVNTIYVSAGDFDRPTENQARARDAFQRIAGAGGGAAFELPVDDPQAGASLRSSVTAATFGDEWLDEIIALQRLAPKDSRLASVERHAARRDRGWLIRKMAVEPIHPAVALACRDLFDGRIAAAMLQQLEDLRLDPPLRAAALYVLQSALESVQDIPYDVYRPAAEQNVALAEIRHHVRQVKGASRYLDGEAGTVAPPEMPPGTGDGGG